MEPELYNAAREGNHSLFEQLVTGTGEDGEASYEHYFGSRTDEGDNILHLAAREGHVEFIEAALDRLPSLVVLVCQSNSHGENPLHVAAEAGHLEIARLLVRAFGSYQMDDNSAASSSSAYHLMVAEEGVAAEPWRARDPRGETPLHKALKGGHEQLASYLLGEDPELACCDNNEDESPLYLAAANCHESFAETILTSSMPYSTKGPNGATPLHAAVYGCTDKTVGLLLRKHPELIRKADSNKETALHLAAKENKVDFTEMLIKADRSAADQHHGEGTPFSAMVTIYAAESIRGKRTKALSVQERAAAYQRDADGFTPLLRAAVMGLVRVVGAILRYSPQSIAICDSKGRTALHLMKLENYQDGSLLFEFPAIQRLINEPDLDGNTPLHLAVEKQDHIMANILIATVNIQPNVKNKEGFTPKDLIKSHQQPTDKMVDIAYHVIMQERHRQTTPDFEVVASATPDEEPPQRSTEAIPERAPIGPTKIHERISPQDASQELQQSFNTLSAIAAILAAVTFAAIFAIPDSFNENGEPNLARNTLFKVFMLSNASAMCGYVLVLFCVLWAMMIAQHGDEPRLLLTFSTRVLQLSFYATLAAFATAAYATISAKTLWLAVILVCLPACVVILTLPTFLPLRLPRALSGLCARR